MITAKELKAWVDRLVERDGDAAVAVDAGGLTLVATYADGSDCGFIEVCGVPVREEEEDEEEPYTDTNAYGDDGSGFGS